ncbi:dienelactone hydrolase family protein [Xanthobacter sp. DSM 24535]|uniref:dienelactone hydrolase family protein n=1 Tax=Roseixanthobacter psychrophilus TaxID=3119917 RepID=UPI003727673A
MIELIASDGHAFSAYRADPVGEPKGAVVVLQELFGVNAHIRKIVDDFALRGYVAIAPALFDRVQPDVALGYDEEGFAAGLALLEQLDDEKALNDVQAAVEAVKDTGKVALVGYSCGGYLAYAAANAVTGIACVIAYYGPGIVEAYGEKRKVPILLHFGEKDPLIPLEQVEQFRASRPNVSAFTYPDATHGFNCEERGSYHAASAQQALERTLFWIAQFVEGQTPLLMKNSGMYAQAKVEKKKSKKSADDDLGPPLD